MGEMGEKGKRVISGEKGRWAEEKRKEGRMEHRVVGDRRRTVK